MKTFLLYQRAYFEFLQDDGFPPIMNELANLTIALAIWLSGKYVFGMTFGIYIAVAFLLFQRWGAHITGKHYLVSGKNLKETKRFVLGKNYKGT